MASRLQRFWQFFDDLGAVEGDRRFVPAERFSFVAHDGEEMTRNLIALREDPVLRSELVRSGLETIRARHSCAHRVDELLSIVAGLAPAQAPALAKDAA